MKSWTMFMIAIGFLLITISPQMENPMGFIIFGLILVLIGVIKMKKKK